MDPNTWYFTLSALAQTLASILGLTGIFVGLKLESITKQIEYYKRRGASILKWEGRKEADDHLLFDAYYILKKLRSFAHKHREDEAILPHLEKTMKRYDPSLRVTPDRAVRFLDDTIYSLEGNLDQKRNIINSIIAPVVINMVAIFASLVLMGLTDYFMHNFAYNVEVLLGVVALAVLGMIDIALISYKILWTIE